MGLHSLICGSGWLILGFEFAGRTRTSYRRGESLAFAHRMDARHGSVLCIFEGPEWEGKMPREWGAQHLGEQDGGVGSELND